MTTAIAMDTEAFKAATRKQWDEAAQSWNDHTPRIRAWLRGATDAMLDMALVRPGARVLDVAAGAGDQTLDLAQRVGPTGAVVATDLSPAILELAQANARRSGFANVETRAADGERLGVDTAAFDAAVCRLGLMFFPDPLQGLREMHRALKPGAGVCTMVFAGPETNPCVAILMSTALRHAGMAPRDPWQPGGLLSLGKPGLIDDLYRRAGFKDIATTRIDAPFRLPSVRDYVEFAQTSASPIREILRGLDAGGVAAAWADIEERLQRFDTAGGWEGPNELLLTAARR
jgi:SAM-dependent methyltransferase